jgi:hypothetical protein
MSTSKMALRRFTLRAAGGYRGRHGGEQFVKELLACFGSDNPDDAGFIVRHAFSTVDDGRRAKRTVAVYWPERRLVIDLVDRDLSLDLAWEPLLRACLQMDVAPQYVVLTNQRDLRLYDLARDRGEPRLAIAFDELPKYSEAFPFLAPDWVPGTTPRIINVDKVSKEVAELVAKVYRALCKRNPGRELDVSRFTLQCIVTMFAEDIGLLPKEYFTTLLYQGAEEGRVEASLADLFAAMSTKDREMGEIPYFNGGLFTDAISLRLGAVPLRALTKAAEANWTFVDPHIFGSVFQGIMTDAERHASGAHYTAREDIMSVVGPTIVDPWRQRIDEATTLAELRAILTGLGSFRVLDPACGSGNFLYVAFRELYRLETEVLCRMFEFASIRKGAVRGTWMSRIQTTNFYGIDINPFAVELAKTTLNIAKKIAFEERRETVLELYEQGFLEIDPSLPLDNLDKNMVCADALFTPWPESDAIIGNPPFLGAKWMRKELGAAYMKRLKATFPDTGGDLSAYWFRLAHDALDAGQRAGLISTSSIRTGKARETTLDYIVDHDGTITMAVSEKPWPGDASVTVSVINWVKGPCPGPFHLHVDGALHTRKSIAPHLQLYVDARKAVPLTVNENGTSQGVTFGTKAFYVSDDQAREIATDPSSRFAVRVVTNGSDLLSGQLERRPSRALCLLNSDDEGSAKGAKAAFEHLKANVFPLVKEKAEKATTAHYRGWLAKWWKPFWSRDVFFRGLKKQRVVMCSRVAARWILAFVSTEIVPVDKIQVFDFDDDYSFGILQSSFHWNWVIAKGGRRESRMVYSNAVWDTFPWPQEVTAESVANVASAGRDLRATRERLMLENAWSLRDLYQSAEVAGPHPLKAAQEALDEAVAKAYGKPGDQEITEFLLEMNQYLAEDEEAGESIAGPGLPPAVPRDDPRWVSADCIAVPTLPAPRSNSSETGGPHG